MAFTPNDDQLMAGMHSERQEIVGPGLKTFYSIRAWPTNIDRMKSVLCDKYIKRNLTKEEWAIFVAPDLLDEYTKTCPNLPDGN
jgi:hypothetical protein